RRLDGITGRCGAVHLGPRQNIVPVGIVTPSVDYLAFLTERGLLAELVFVTVEIGHVFRHTFAFGVVPGALANTVARIDRRLTIGSGGAQIGVPGTVGGSRSGGQSLAVLIGPTQTA